MEKETKIKIERLFLGNLETYLDNVLNIIKLYQRPFQLTKNKNSLVKYIQKHS